jgi:hypothetical protein
MNKQMLSILFFVMVSFFSVSSSFGQSNMDDVTVIDLTQTVNEFNVKGMELKPGKYQFKVTNLSVDKEVGFVIQKKEDSAKDVMKTAVENSFTKALISKGSTQLTGIVELKEGQYVYSCPLNPTPHYVLTVK